MTVHRNAKTTPAMRQLIITRVLHQGWSYAKVAEALGLSVRTIAKWVARYRQGGRDALADAPSRPRRHPRQTPLAAVSAIVAARQQRWPAWKIGRALRIPRSTVSRVLRRSGLNRLPALASPRPVQRYEWPHAGDLLHLDIKPLGRIRGVGHRFLHPSVRVHTRGGGWEYVHVAVDDHTRLAYVEVLRSQRATACQAFVCRAVRWFMRRGIAIRRILTDNGGGYCSRRFARSCQLRGIRHKRTRPYRPQTNGKAERFIQTLLREWAYIRPYPTSLRRTAALSRWLYYYNHQRPHAALGYHAPWFRFRVAAA